jgi:hypothetical protein
MPQASRRQGPHRWGLLLATLLGLLAMHGIGSHGVHGADADMAPMSHVAEHADHAAMPAADAAAVSGPTHGGGGMGFEAVCVAIMAGLVLTLGRPRRVRSTADQPGHPVHGRVAVRPRARGPDPPKLTELSILRC